MILSQRRIPAEEFDAALLRPLVTCNVESRLLDHSLNPPVTKWLISTVKCPVNNLAVLG